MDKKSLNETLKKQKLEADLRLQEMHHNVKYNVDTVLVNKDNFDKVTSVSHARFWPNRQDIEVDYLKLDTAGMGDMAPKYQKLIDIANNYYESDKTLIHEQKHKDNDAKGLRALELRVSQKQVIMLRAHDEITANIAEALALRKRYMVTGDISELRGDECKAYREAIEKGIIKPGSADPKMFDKEMSILVNGVKDWWIQDCRDGQYFENHFLNSQANVFKKDDMKAYQKGVEICYDFGGVNLAKYLDKDVEIGEKNEKAIAAYEKSNPSYKHARFSKYVLEYFRKPIRRFVSWFESHDNQRKLENVGDLLAHEVAERAESNRLLAANVTGSKDVVEKKSRNSSSTSNSAPRSLENMDLASFRKEAAKHRYDYADKRTDISLKQWAELQMGNALAWDMRLLMREREEYIKTKNLNVFSKGFEFYKEAIASGKVSATSAKKFTSAELELMAKGVAEKNEGFDTVIANNLEWVSGKIDKLPPENKEQMQKLSAEVYKVNGMDLEPYIKGKISLKETDKKLKIAQAGKSQKYKNLIGELRGTNQSGDIPRSLKVINPKIKEFAAQQLRDIA